MSYPCVETIRYDAWQYASEDENDEVWVEVEAVVMSWNETCHATHIIIVRVYPSDATSECGPPTDLQLAWWDLESQVVDYFVHIKTPCNHCKHLIQNHIEVKDGFRCAVSGCSCKTPTFDV